MCFPDNRGRVACLWRRVRRRGIDGNLASFVDFDGCRIGEDLEGSDPVLMEMLFRFLYEVS